MQNSDGLTKLLLILLVVGVWGLLIKSFFPASSIQTQSRKQYVIGAIDEHGKIRFDGSGSSIGLTASGLSNARGVLIRGLMPLTNPRDKT